MSIVAQAMDPEFETRLRRIRIRSWRRGIREMDLILGGFADAELAGLDRDEIDAFECLLSEDDHDVYQWVAGRNEAPAGHQGMVGRIRRFHRAEGLTEP